MRHDMIYSRCSSSPRGCLLLAYCTEGMLSQERFAVFIPASIVASRPGARAVLIECAPLRLLLCLVLLAVGRAEPGMGQGRTAGS
jgi:hypothetical protein